MSAEVADVLDKAAEVIETRGWYQGSYYPPNAPSVFTCSVCAMGAIAAAVHHGDPDADCGPSEIWTAGNALAKHLGLNDGEDGVPEWNDKPERTAAEVIAALRNAASSERAP